MPEIMNYQVHTSHHNHAYTPAAPTGQDVLK